MKRMRCFYRAAFALSSMALAGCVSDSITYNPDTRQLTAHRTALFTNIGELHAEVSRDAVGTVSARVDEKAIDQTTAAANALQAAAQLSLEAAKALTPAP